ASDSERRTVERMHRLRLVRLRVAPACLHASSLIRLEVAARRNLAVALLTRQPCFQVVSLRAAITDVASTQGHDAIGQLQALQHFLSVRRELLERRIRIRRPHDMHDFDLIELMLTDYA